MKRVILDTNFLLIPYIFKVDIFSEITRLVHDAFAFYVLDITLLELEKIVKEQKGKDRDAAKMALQLVEMKKINIIDTEMAGNVDRYLIEHCNKNDIVATQDIELKRLLRDKNLNIIVLRKKKYLNMVEI